MVIIVGGSLKMATDKMKKLLLIFVLLCVAVPVWGQWIPRDYQSWYDSGNPDKKQTQIGGEFKNYMRPDSSWAKINNDWVVEGDSAVCRDAVLQTVVRRATSERLASA